MADGRLRAGIAPVRAPWARHCQSPSATKAPEAAVSTWLREESRLRGYGLISIGVPSAVMSQISTMSEFDTATQPSVQSQSA